MKLTEQLLAAEEKLKELLDDVQNLKMQVYAMEEQNESLRRKLYQRKDTGEGFDNLVRLYEESFHVCPAHFGSYRSAGEDCLFCLSFLKRAGDGGQSHG
ncbi:DNA replication initiation control protein YabA [Metallumcola ferriviriculae]|uniref:DNA replication initiation control protein YabA n=1 Tax=Metallumcola ferriviriculae TaxID=3039180 RepID=A0AAU0UJW9_9FIRM|nr:DNA replication initiation control protein YabA [Desulfitibacteraceae bacterium MK1]